MRLRCHGLRDVVPWCGSFLEILEDEDLITGGLEGLVGNFAEIRSNFKDFRDWRTRSLRHLNLLSWFHPFSELSDVVLTTLLCSSSLSSIGKMMNVRWRKEIKKQEKHKGNKCVFPLMNKWNIK